MVNRLTNGDGPEVVIEAVGLPETFTAAVELVCFAGRVVYVGYVKEKVQYETKTFVAKELDIRGSRNALSSDLEKTIDALRRQDINFAPLITHRYDFEQLPQALSDWDAYPENVTKILINM